MGLLGAYGATACGSSSERHHGRWRAWGGSRIVGDSSEGYIDDADMQVGALDTLDALLRSGIPGVHTRVATWLAAGHDGPEVP